MNETVQENRAIIVKELATREFEVDNRAAAGIALDRGAKGDSRCHR
jgi:hypothetical protein